MELRKLADLDLRGKRVFLRLDLNVPMKDGKITDVTRIEAALPTLRYILERTHKVAIASHLGRPKARDPKFSLEPVGRKLAEYLEKEIAFVADYDEQPIYKVLDNINTDQFVLLENVRFYPGETKNDPEFSRHLMAMMDVYVNDAFGSAHRAHATVVGAAEVLPPQKRAAGFLIQKEVNILSELTNKPETPFAVIMGGAKVSDKISVILNMINRCNHILVGGAMAYTLLKYRGVDVGNSRIEADQMDLAEKIFRNAEARKVNIHLPVDHVCAKEFDERTAAVPVNTPNIPQDLMGLDIGPKTIAQFSNVIQQSRTILWNGPMGVFEWPQFRNGTMAIARKLAEVDAKTVVGGGDSVSAVNMAGVADKIYHISTGGGASLEFLEGKTLPGLKVLAV